MSFSRQHLDVEKEAQHVSCYKRVWLPSTWLPTNSFTSPSVDFCSCLSSKNLRSLPCLFQRYYAPSREQRPNIGHDQYAGAHLCAPPGMGEELQSHLKIKANPLPLLGLLHVAPHLPELESFCQDESPPGHPGISSSSSSSYSLSTFLILSGGRLFSLVLNILLRPQQYHRASDQSASLIMQNILQMLPLLSLIFTSVTLIRDLGDNSTVCVQRYTQGLFLILSRCMEDNVIRIYFPSA